MPKTCPEGKELNPRTNNCVKICGPNQVRNLQTGRCIKASEDVRANFNNRVNLVGGPGKSETKKTRSTPILCPEGKEPNPKTRKCVNKCKPGQVRNPETGRCIKSANTKARTPTPEPQSAKKTPILCPEGKEPNPKTRKCVNKCKPGQVRNPETGKCIKSTNAKARTPTPEPAKARTPTPEPAKARTPTPEPAKARTPTPEPAKPAKPAKAAKYMIFHSKSALLNKDNEYGLPVDAMRRLSNFSMDSVEYDGQVYPSGEHAYQAQKYAFAGRPDLVKMFYTNKFKTAAEAKSAGGKGGMAKNGVSMTPDQLKKFLAANDDIMQKIVESKVKRNPEILNILRKLREHNIKVIHHSRTDMVWGAHMKPDASGVLRGENKLGEFYNNVKI